jgi:hypothetical protein
MLHTKFRFIWPSGFREVFFLEIDQPETRIAYDGHVCLRIGMSNHYRGPSMDAPYQVTAHLAKRFQRRRLKCEKLTEHGRRTTDDKLWHKCKQIGLFL